MRGGAAGQIVLPISELPDVHGDATIAPRDVPAVFGGLDMAMVVHSLDSYDSIRTTDHPVELPPLAGTSVTHPEDVSVLLDMTDTVLTRRIPAGYPQDIAWSVCCCWSAGRNFADLCLWFGFARFSGYG